MKLLTNAQYNDMLEQHAMLERYNSRLKREVHDLQIIRHQRTAVKIVEQVKEITKVRIEQNVFDALVKELPKPCVPKSELEAGVLLGVQMVLERIRQGWVV